MIGPATRCYHLYCTGPNICTVRARCAHGRDYPLSAPRKITDKHANGNFGKSQKITGTDGNVLGKSRTEPEGNGRAESRKRTDTFWANHGRNRTETGRAKSRKTTDRIFGLKHGHRTIPAHSVRCPSLGTLGAWVGVPYRACIPRGLSTGGRLHRRGGGVGLMLVVWAAFSGL